MRGRVQGVGFRYFVLDRALQLGLRGWVRNLSAGGVEVHAEGGPEAIDRLGAELRRGPMMARVTEVVEENVPTTQSYTSFSIRG